MIVLWIESTKPLMALGWSPLGSNFEDNSKFILRVMLIDFDNNQIRPRICR